MAAFIYLVIVAGVGAGIYTNNPYKGSSMAVLEAAGGGLAWPVVVIDLLVERVGKHYDNVGG